MITLKTCTICQLEYDSVLQQCPHCRSIASGHSDQLKINLENTQESIDKNLAREKGFYLTISGDAVQVDMETAQLHPLFGVKGGLSYFKWSLPLIPLVGIAFAISQFKTIYGAYPFWFFFSCGLEIVFFVWAYSLSRELYKCHNRAIDLIFKYLIISTVIGITSAYLCYKLNNSVLINSSPLVLFQTIKTALFAFAASLYLKTSERVKITFNHIIKKDDPFFLTNDYGIESLPNDRAWLAHAEDFSNMTKNTLASNHKTLANFANRGGPENLPNIQAAGLEDVEKFSLRIAALKNALNEDLITLEDYENKKKQILDEL